ncbi:TonB-dependent receptor [Asticcacaulis sp. SL142]|uniref:TonB-dependent receptor domain-containing protein n=1 Tax=Asticcacaulis sp. SL142 TaxID=2995155 RepID=UPI00226CD9FF|nr:TonB-dependent receptor [Asticcacaulis sp. SL142]WAC46790.1 TonB-dependent receptor [Asticcacaulis sp. SL142]
MQTTKKRAVMLAGAAFSALLTGLSAAPVFAQDAPAEPVAEEAVQEVVVTGTRIRRPNLKSASPITTVSSEEVQLQGAIAVDSFLNDLPMFTADANENGSNGSDGTARINLRNLGSSRNLVLLDGQRFLPTLGVDVNFIPSTLIERTDVMTGGASSVYGSDAISGVVNFITKKNLQGVRIDANYSIYNHQNDDSYLRGINTAKGNELPDKNVWDGAKTDFNIAAGSNFEDGKGNVTAYFGYRKMDAVTQDSRDVSNCALNASGTNGSDLSCGGSPQHGYGRFLVLDEDNPFSGNDYSNAKDGSKTWALTDSSYDYNYAPTNYFQRDSERYTAGAFAHYDLNEHAQFYGSFMFMDDHSVSQAAPSAIWFYNPFTINCDNPYMSTAQRSILCAGATAQATGETKAYVTMRAVNGEPRRNDMRHTDYRFSGGVKGQINDAFSYDVNYMYASILDRANYQNDINQNKAAQALQAETVNGEIVCKDTSNGCVPIDVFSATGPTAAMYEFLYAPTYTKTDQTLKSFGGFISGDLGRYGVTSPWAADGLAMVLGFEHREETLDTRYDQVQLDAGQNDIDGKVKAEEIYAELDVPIASDKPYINSLDLSLGYRTSTFNVSSSTVSGIEKDTETYKIELKYSPTPDVLFRTSYNKAMRAANISELFAAQGVGNSSYDDPCSKGNLNLAEHPTLEECMRTGVTEAQYNNKSIIDCAAGVCTALGGGNPNLDPETAKTLTYGFVLTPQAIPGLSVSLDYFDIHIDDYIGTISPSVTMSQCISTGDPYYCNLINRASNGVLTSPNLQTDGYVIATNLNTGYLETTGFDVTANYTLKTDELFGADYGSVNFAMVGTLLKSLETEVLPGLGSYDCTGLFGPTCGQPSPEWRHNVRATWNLPWKDVVWAPESLSINWRYFGEVSLTNNTSDPYLTGTVSERNAKIEAYNYIDVAASYKLRGMAIRVGVNNLFDKAPPAVANGLLYSFGNGNTYPGTYDALGRMVFVGLSAKF